MKKMLLFVISLFLIFPIDISAKTLGELKKELENLEISQKQAEYNKTFTKAQMEQINKKMAEISSQISTIENERKQIATDIENLNIEIEKRDQEMKDIINFLQISNGESAYLEYMFGAKDFTDFIYRVAVSEQLTDYNNNLIIEYNDLITQNNKRKEELNIKEKQLENSQKEYGNELSKLGSELNNIYDLGMSLEEEIKAQKEVINHYQNKLGCKDDEDIETCGRNYLPPGTSFFRPVVSGYITSDYGVYRCYYLGSGLTCDVHDGLDIASNVVAPPVYSIANGIVVYVMYQSSCGGNRVFVQHKINGVNYTSQYAHLLSINVKVGDVVNQNSIIGYMGGNPSVTWWDGCSTGQHLHLSLSKGLFPDGDANWWARFVANQVNPRNYINFPAGLWNSFNDKLIKY